LLIQLLAATGRVAFVLAPQVEFGNEWSWAAWIRGRGERGVESPGAATTCPHKPSSKARLKRAPIHRRGKNGQENAFMTFASLRTLVRFLSESPGTKPSRFSSPANRTHPSYDRFL